MSTDVLFRPTFADLRAEVERRVAQDAPPDEIAAMLDQLLGGAPAPWVEYNGAVTWLYRDVAAQHVAVVGDIVGYDTDKTAMTRLPGSDLFYLTAEIPLDARIKYVFAVDRPAPAGDQPGEWSDWLRGCATDPLNPRQLIETRPLRAYSLLEMPGALPAPEFDDPQGEVVANVVMHVLRSPALDTWLRVWVALPLGYDPDATRYPTLYLYDGEGYMLSARAPQLLDTLLNNGEIGHAIAVFVERPDGYVADEQYGRRAASFLADELVPWIDAHYATSSDPADRVAGGASVGAAVGLYAALERPEVFGRVLAQSPVPLPFAEYTMALLERNAERGLAPPLCYVDVGRYEPALVVEHVQSLCSALLAYHARVSYQEFAGDHSFVGWRTTLADALRFHFGAPLFP
jgi:enterochelin esterase-like enzyme